MTPAPTDLLTLLRALYSRLGDDARRLEREARAVRSRPTANRRSVDAAERRLDDVLAQRRACLAEIAARENAPGVDVVEAPKSIKTTAQLRAAIERARR